MLTNEQLAERRQWLGASDVAVLFGISPYRTQWELWADKRGMLEDSRGNAATHAGTRLERALLDEAEHVLGPIDRDVVLRDYNSVIVSRCDAVVVATDTPVECKTTGITGPIYGDWGEAGTSEIPLYYLVQCQCQIACCGSDECHVIALIPGRGFVWYLVPRNDVVITNIRDTANEWWERHIVRGEEPEIDTAPPLEVVKRLRRVPEKVVELNACDIGTVDVIALLKDKRKAVQDEINESEAGLLLALGDAECGKLPDGREVTYYETTRTGYEVKPTTYRSLRITKGK